MIGKIKKSIQHRLLRPFFEKLKIDTYSRPSSFDLDKKLEMYLNFEDGTFLEVGANDGFKQSNSYYFEKIKGWKGVLIEPIPLLFNKCKRLRSRSEVFNYICSVPEDSGKIRTINYADLMSLVEGAMGDSEEEKKHLNTGIQIQNLKKSYSVQVPCKTLSEIIDESSFSNFDFMSIDVEGYELQVIKGLNLPNHAPKFLLIETWPHEEEDITNYLSDYYEIVEKLTQRDILFKRKS